MQQPVPAAAGHLVVQDDKVGLDGVGASSTMSGSFATPGSRWSRRSRCDWGIEALTGDLVRLGRDRPEAANASTPSSSRSSQTSNAAWRTSHPGTSTQTAPGPSWARRSRRAASTTTPAGPIGGSGLSLNPPNLAGRAPAACGGILVLFPGSRSISFALPHAAAMCPRMSCWSVVTLARGDEAVPELFLFHPVGAARSDTSPWSTRWRAAAPSTRST